MNKPVDYLLAAKAYEASGKQWTPEQTKKIESSGYFETAKEIHIFGKTYFLSPSNYKALGAAMVISGLIISFILTLLVVKVIRPGGLVDAWVRVSDGKVGR
jgi:hypothetical protein